MEYGADICDSHNNLRASVLRAEAVRDQEFGLFEKQDIISQDSTSVNREHSEQSNQNSENYLKETKNCARITSSDVELKHL